MNTISTENITLTEISEAAYKWLSDLGQKINKPFFKAEILTHPDYPALTSLTDLLDAGNMDYAVQRISMEEAKTSINFPCIVNLHLSNNNSGLYQVSNLSALESVKDFWSGIVLHASTESKWQHPQHEEVLLKSKKNLISFIAVGFSLIILSLIIGINLNHPLNLGWILSSTIGILTSVLLLSQELGLATEIVQKVCGMGGNKTGCASVLSSKYARGKFGFSIATIALAYFCTQWLFFIIAPYNLLASVTALTITKVAVLSIVIAGWSLYTQKFVIKQWCTLCLIVVSLLLFQFALSFIQTGDFNWLASLPFIIVFLSTLLVVLPIKKLVENLNVLQGTERELKKWQRDTYLILNQWKQQPETNCDVMDDELELATPGAPIQFTIACNPYCNPCAKAHQQIEQLIATYGAYISVKVRFSANYNDENNETTQVVNLIRNASDLYKEPREILHQWFKDMDNKVFQSKYPKASSQHNYSFIKKQSDWANAANIRFTPTIFLNNRELPKRYTLSDIIQMIPEIYNQITHNKR